MRRIDVRTSTPKDWPTVEFGLLGEESYIFSFIDPLSPEVKLIAERFKNLEPRAIVKHVLNYIGATIKYPFTRRGTPASARETRIFK